MFRFILFLLMIGSVGSLPAQSASARSTINGLCGNYDGGNDDCRLLNDEVFPGGLLDLEIFSCGPDVANISLRRLDDGQPLVEVARRLHAGQQVLSVGVPDYAEPGWYLLEVRTRDGNFADVLEML